MTVVLLWQFRTEPLTMNSAKLSLLKSCFADLGMIPQARTKMYVPEQAPDVDEDNEWAFLQ